MSSARKQAEPGHRGLHVGFREVDLGRVVRVGGTKGKGEQGPSLSRFGFNLNFLHTFQILIVFSFKFLIIK